MRTPTLALVASLGIGLSLFHVGEADACEACDQEATTSTPAHYTGPAVTHTARIDVEGMTCEGCSKGLGRAFLRQPGVLAAEVRFAEKSAVVNYDPAVTSAAKLITTINGAGAFTASLGKDAVVESIHIDVDAMRCGGCAEKVSEAVKRLEGVRDVEVRVSEKLAVVSVAPGTVAADRVVAAITAAGYAARLHAPPTIAAKPQG